MGQWFKQRTQGIFYQTGWILGLWFLSYIGTVDFRYIAVKYYITLHTDQQQQTYQIGEAVNSWTTPLMGELECFLWSSLVDNAMRYQLVHCIEICPNLAWESIEAQCGMVRKVICVHEISLTKKTSCAHKWGQYTPVLISTHPIKKYPTNSPIFKSLW